MLQGAKQFGLFGNTGSSGDAPDPRNTRELGNGKPGDQHRDKKPKKPVGIKTMWPKKIDAFQQAHRFESSSKQGRTFTPVTWHSLCHNLHMFFLVYIDIFRWM